MNNLNMKRAIVLGLAVTGISITAPINASAQWKSDDNGYMYTQNNTNVKGWKHLDHTNYFTGESSDENLCIEQVPLNIGKLYSTDIDLTDFKEFDSTKPGKYRIPFATGSGYTTRYKEFEIK